MIGMFGPMKRRNMFSDAGQAPQVGQLTPPPMQQPAQQPEMRISAPAWGPEDEKPKGGLFGDPNFADKLSAIGGMFMANAGNPMGQQLVQNYYAKQENDRQMQQRAAAAEQARAQVREDMQWEWQNKPRDPYRFEANNGDQIEVGPDGQHRTLYADPTPKVTWVLADDGEGGKELRAVGPYGPLDANPTPAPTKPVGALKLIPDQPINNGGQTPQASGGFPAY